MIQTIITCYDYPTARVFDETDVDVIFVGDSVGTNMLGYQSELEVTMSDMLHHFKAVRRGVKNKILMVDLPYNTYATKEDALKNTRVFSDRGANIVKLEGGREIAPQVETLTNEGIQVMGHIGFQPQLANKERRSVVGSRVDEAVALYQDACALRDAGARYLLFECIPEMVAKEITEIVGLPTIGIGSGKYCTGQVLVSTDLLGWYDMPYRFIKRYARFAEEAESAVNEWVREVRELEFPQRNHGFRIPKDELMAFREAIASKSPNSKP